MCSIRDFGRCSDYIFSLQKLSKLHPERNKDLPNGLSKRKYTLFARLGAVGERKEVRKKACGVASVQGSAQKKDVLWSHCLGLSPSSACSKLSDLSKLPLRASFTPL